MTLLNNSLNVFNEPLLICGTSPMTGAYQANVAPPILLKATHVKTLEYISLEELMKFEFKPLTN